VARSDIVEQKVEEGLWKSPIGVVSDSVRILAEYLKDIFVVSHHEEEGLKTFEGIAEVGGGLSLQYSLDAGVRRPGELLLVERIHEAFLRIAQAQSLLIVLLM
jgi:hypothetical protein